MTRRQKKAVLLAAISLVLAASGFALGERGRWIAAAGLWLMGALPLAAVITRRKHQRFANVLGVISFLVLLAFLEAGLRASPMNARLLPLGVGRDFKPHPYLFWFPKKTAREPAPAANAPMSGDPEAALEMDFRSGPVRVPKEPGVFRVMVMGSSNAWGQGVKNYDDTLTGRLARMAAEAYPGCRFEFISAGVKAFRAFQNLVFYKLFLRQYKPDLVIFYSNVNDSFQLDGPYTFRELFTMRTGVDISRLWIDEFEFPKKPSVISRVQDGLSFLRTYNAMVWWIRNLREDIEPGGGRSPVLKDVNPAEDYERNLRDMVEIMRRDGARLVFADAYTAYPDAGERDPTFRIQWVRDIMKKVAAETGTPFVPVFEVLRANFDPYLLLQREDTVHINERGHLEAAKLIFAALREKRLLE